MQEDPTFRVHTDTETGQTLIAGMGELHLEIIVDRLMREFNVGANVGKPQVAYRETITAGGRRRGQVRAPDRRPRPVRPRQDPLAARRRRGRTSCSTTRSSAAHPQGVHQADRAGHQGGAGDGSAGGLSRARASRSTLYDGSYHDVDSSEIAFKIAGSMAFQDACKRARPVLMEPIMEVEVVTPEEYMGDVIGDINSRRGRIQAWRRAATPR